jgi:hypothetical protein
MPSPGTLIALVALFVALGGPAEAAKLISGKDIKKNAITSKHVKNRSLAVGDLSNAAVRALGATPANSVGTVQIVDGSIAAADIAPNSLGSGQIADQSLGGVDIATSAVSSDEIAPNSIQDDEVSDGRLGARDVGSFVGTVPIDFPAVGVDACQFFDADVAAVAATNPPRSVGDDAVIVTPPGSFPDDKLILTAAPVGPTKVRVRICNFNGAEAIDLPSLNYRYISFDF